MLKKAVEDYRNTRQSGYFSFILFKLLNCAQAFSIFSSRKQR